MDIARRNFIAGLGGVAVAAPILASCARGDGGGGGDTSTAATPAPATGTPKSPIPPPVTSEPGTLLSQEPVDTAITGARA